MTTVIATLTGFAVVVTAYLTLWNSVQIVMGAVAAGSMWRHRRRRTQRDQALVTRLASPPQISIVMPAFNEELTIVEGVRALLAVEYESREIVVVNDGSSDGTLERLQQSFHLLPGPLAFARPLASAPVRGVYRSVDEPSLVVIDKEAGGCKADAANAGINAASGLLVLVIDADTVLEPDALSRAVLPFLEDAATVAVGGYVAIGNGYRIDGGRVTGIALPRRWLARFQVVEYMRSFLLFRMFCASQNAVVIVSGAFGLFLREAVIAVGGFDKTAIGEDMDLTVRLQLFYRTRRQRFRIAFDPRPLCATLAPEDLASLKSQRCRWRRGLLQVLWRHRRMIGNPRFGAIGLGALPHMVLFEAFGPLLELAGYVVTTLAWCFGLLDVTHFRILLFVAVIYGAATSVLAVLLSESQSRLKMRARDLALLIVVAALDNCGYRQLNAWWAVVGTVQAARGKSGWGVLRRRAFEGKAPA
jgi:cellulose synthase/poly-beta-1,6-N-acetylglucosamine synthase-like glycosyltransferase